MMKTSNKMWINADIKMIGQNGKKSFKQRQNH